MRNVRPTQLSSCCLRHTARLRSAIANAAATPDKAPPGDASPTFVPRQEGIKPGRWRAVDSKLVSSALDDGSPKAINSRALLGRSIEELQEVVCSLKEQPYRGKQVHDNLMQGARTLDGLKSVPMRLRDKLADAGFEVGRSTLVDAVQAADGTKKFLCRLADGLVVEAVGIPMDGNGNGRLTACISSQVGCPMRCTFCATGKGGFARNLAVHEIVEQVLTVQEGFGRRVSNVVFMGMGEPLLNIRAVVAAVSSIQRDLRIGARNITISTVGVHRQLERLAAHKLQCTLAVSLHAPSQELREQLIPSARVYPIDALLQDCKRYFNSTSRRVTFEYTLLKDVNDSEAQARALATLLKSHAIITHINLIPWNPVEESTFERPSGNRVRKFKERLEAEGYTVTVRATRGMSVAAACGQLRNAYQRVAMPAP